MVGKLWVRGLHVKYIEKLYWLPLRYKNFTVPDLLKKVKFNIKPLLRSSKYAVFYDELAMHPKSLDSSKVFNKDSFVNVVDIFIVDVSVFG